MYADPRQYSHVLDILDKPDLTINWYWIRSSDCQWFNYLPDKPDFSYDYIKYTNGYWDGVTNFTSVAVYNDFDDVRVPFKEFVNLVDFQSHLLKTVYGYSIKNNYRTIYIFSYKSINSIYKRFKLKKNWFNLFIV